MSFKIWFNLQIVKIKKTAAIGSVVLLVLNLSLNIYPLVEHRNFHPYFMIPLIFLTTLFIVWLGSHLYIRILGMYKEEALAEKVYNPYNVYAIGPFEEMTYYAIYLPLMEACYHLLPTGEQKEKLKEQIETFKHWLELGFIPKEDFPEHLKKYYIVENPKRL